MSAPLFLLRPEYRHWNDYLNRTHWDVGDLDDVIEQACHQAYCWSIPARICVNDIVLYTFGEAEGDVSPMRVLAFYRRAARNLVAEKCGYFGLLTREGNNERP